MIDNDTKMNIELLHHEIKNLKNELLNMSMFIQDMTFHVNAMNDDLSYVHWQYGQSREWSIPTSFNGTIEVDCYVITQPGTNEVRKVNPTIENSCGTITLYFDQMVEGYARIKEMDAIASFGHLNYSVYQPNLNIDLCWDTVQEFNSDVVDANLCNEVMLGNPQECSLPYPSEDEEENNHNHYDNVMKGLL
jgi:hypothetical protein